MRFYCKKIIIATSILFCTLLSFCSIENEEIAKIYIQNQKSINWKTKDSCKISLVEGKDSLLMTAGIKYRGGASSKYWKHSFSLELDEAYPISGLPTDDDWILNASYVDKTFMRHKISYDLFNEMNPKNKAPLSDYVWLTQNDKAQGLYLIMQEINASFLELDKNDTMAMLFKEPYIFYEDKNHYVKDTNNYYQQKYPKIFESDKTYYIEEFKHFLFYSSDGEFAKNINKWVDLENVIDWHLILLFSNNGDGLRKNFFLYKQNSQSPFKFAIWDYDHSFGREGDYELNMMTRELNCRKVILLKRLMDIKETGYNIRLEKRYQSLRDEKTFSLQNINKLISKNDKTIAPYIDQNAELWPMKSKWYDDENTYPQELDLIKEYCTIRIPQLDKRFHYTSNEH